MQERKKIIKISEGRDMSQSLVFDYKRESRGQEMDMRADMYLHSWSPHDMLYVSQCAGCVKSLGWCKNHLVTDGLWRRTHGLERALSTLQTATLPQQIILICIKILVYYTNNIVDFLNQLVQGSFCRPFILLTHFFGPLCNFWHHFFPRKYGKHKA